jgi:hypothetical protein
MRHPFISFTAWTTVVAVVVSALWLAVVEGQMRSNSDALPRSIGMRLAEPQRDARAHSTAPAALAASAEPANASATVRAQTLAWTR